MPVLPDNPPAFPVSTIDNFTNEGMTLRDWFAGMVMASAVALPMGKADCEFRALVAYQQADALLAERSKSGEGSHAE